MGLEIGTGLRDWICKIPAMRCRGAGMGKAFNEKRKWELGRCSVRTQLREESLCIPFYTAGVFVLTYDTNRS